MSFAAGILRGLAPILCALSLCSAAAFGQTASNVKCKKCVDAGDLAKRAVVKRTIAKGAVTRKKIAPGAVDSARLVDGAVIGPKIGDGAVTGEKVRDGAISAANLAPSAVTGDKIAPLAVTGLKLALGAVTDAKIADGAINGDSLAGSITGAKFAVDSVTAEKIAPGIGGLKLARTIVIGAIGTPTENGDALRLTLFNINDNAADNRYLIKLEPGIYDFGMNGLFMKPFVDIEGSGAGTTVIRGDRGGGGLVQLTNDVVLRALAVEHDSDVTCCTPTAIDGRDTDVNVRLTHVTAHAENDLGRAFGIRLEALALLSHVSASAVAMTFAYGISISGGGFQLSNVTGTGSSPSPSGNPRGLSASGPAGTATAVRDSVFIGTPAVQAAGPHTVEFSATQLVGGRIGGATFRCIGAYDANFAALDDSCNVPVP